MTMTRTWIAAGVLSLVVGGAAADQMRTQLTKENRFPDYGKWEAGLDLRMEELQLIPDGFVEEDADSYYVTPFARYQAFERVSLLARVPYVDVNSDVGESASGLGDIKLGAEWLAYENIFTFPYIIPYITLALGTGDADEGLDRGENGVTLGTTVGTMRWEVFTFNLDLNYTVFEDIDNLLVAAVSVIWDISDQFSAQLEGAVTDEEYGPDEDNPYLFLGGLSYQPYERVGWTLFGGAGDNGQPDVLVGLRVTWNI